MFECVVSIVVPLKMKGVPTEDTDYTTQAIAKFDFDPGLQVGDEVYVQNLAMGGWEDPEFNFLASVQKRQKEIIAKGKTKTKPDIFRLSITLEVADKEHVARVAEIMKRLNPGGFED